MVKRVDNFCRFWEVIDWFNESRRQIFYGAVKIADDSMSFIHFITTPKGNLPHYSYILGEKEPLGTEITNVACYRLGTMLHLEIQKGKEAMKAESLQHDIRETTLFTNRLMMATKGCI